MKLTRRGLLKGLLGLPFVAVLGGKEMTGSPAPSVASVPPDAGVMGYWGQRGNDALEGNITWISLRSVPANAIITGITMEVSDAT